MIIELIVTLKKGLTNENVEIVYIIQELPRMVQIKNILLYVFLCFNSILNCQSPGFLIWSIDNQRYNNFQEFGTTLNNELFVKSEHLCDDKPDFGLYQCTKISHLNSNLQFNYSSDVEFFVSNCTNCLRLFNENLVIGGKILSNELNQVSIDIKNYDLFLNEISSTTIDTLQNPEKINFEGIEFDSENNVYLYGNFENNIIHQNIFLIKLDSSYNFVWRTDLKRSRINEPFDFQISSDNNLFLTNKYFSQAGSAGEFGFQIIKLNADGTVLDSIEFSREIIKAPKLLVHSDNSVYASTKENPINFIFPSHGRINKYDKDLDSLIWSVELPFDNFTNARRYDIRDFTEASNGDILVCGFVFDEEENAPLENPLNHVNNGFAVRLNSNGEILWLKLYKIQNNNPDLPVEDYGDFMQGSLLKIKELENGNILMGGTVSYSPQQLSALFQGSETLSFNWMMIVDRNGCIENDNCNEIIVLNPLIQPKTLIDENSRWNYCLVPDASEKITVDLTLESEGLNADSLYEYYTITGDFMSRTANYRKDTITLASQNDMLYYIGNQDSLFILNDFSVNVGDTLTQRFPIEIDSSWHLDNPLTPIYYQIVIDSIQNVLINDRSLKRVYFTQVNEFNEDLEFKWTPVDLGRYYTEYIGFENFLLPYVNTGLDDTNTNCDLNEFQSLNLYFENPEAYCNPLSIGKTEEFTEVKLYPNPTDGILNIEADPLTFNLIKVYSLNGVLLKEMSFENKVDLTYLPKGIYYLELISKNSSVMLKAIIF